LSIVITLPAILGRFCSSYLNI